MIEDDRSTDKKDHTVSSDPIGKDGGDRSRRGKAFIFVVALASGAAAWLLGGVEAVGDGASEGAATIGAVALRILLAVMLAGFVQVLLPRDVIARWLGAGSGLKGILAATLAGTLSIGGPMTSFPLVVALAAAGADIGALVAFLSAWSLLSVQRIFVWELSFLGPEFTLLRVASCVVLPVIAGLLARVIHRHLSGPAVLKNPDT